MKILNTFILFVVLVIPSALFAMPDNMSFVAVSKTKNLSSIESGIDTAVEDMNFIARPIARKRLKKTNDPIKNISIKVSAEMITVNYYGRDVSSKKDGTKTPFVTNKGEKMTMSQTVSGDRITQTFFAEDGVKKLVFTFNEDHTRLRVDVTLTSPKIPKPLKYTMRFKAK